MHKKKKKFLSNMQILTIGTSICISGFLFSTVSNADGNLRISGSDRYETSMNILKHLGSKDEIYIATGKNFPDALSIGPISHIQEKPLLLIKENDSEIKSLKEAKIKKITIIGGTSSISKNFENKLKKDFEVTRISGKDRYETSRKIARLVTNKKVGVATGETYPDALVASSYLGKNKMPLILIDNNKNINIPEDKEAIYTFGGISSVNKTYGKRISGKDRYETSRKIADEFKNYENIIIVSGENFADALSSAPLGKKYNAPIILTKSNKIDDSSKNILKKAKKVILVGGETSISKNIEKEIIDARTNKTENSSSKPKDNSSLENNELKKAKDELGKRIEDLKKIEKNMYTKNSYSIFNDKIINAEKKLKKENDIKKIKSALEDLKEIEKLLVRKGDIQKLKKAIEDASNEAKKNDVYTEESIKKLEKVIEEIKKNDFENLNETQTKDIIKKLDDTIKALDKKIIPQKTLADNFDIGNFEKISVKDINSPSNEELEQLKNKVGNVERVEKIENKNELKIIFTDNSSKIVNYTDVFKNTPATPEEPELPEKLKNVKIKAPGTYSYKKIEIEEDADSKTWLEEIKKGNCKISVFMYKNQTNKRELKSTKKEVDGYKVGEKGEKNYLFIYGAKENEFISIEVKGYEKIYAKVVKDAFSPQFNYSLRIINESEIPADSQSSEPNEEINNLKKEINKKIEEYEEIKKLPVAKYTKSSFEKYEKEILEAKKLIKEDNIKLEKLKNIIKEIDSTKSELKLLGNSDELLKQIDMAKKLCDNNAYTKTARDNLKKYLKKFDNINIDRLDYTKEKVNSLEQEIENQITIFNNSQIVVVILETKNEKFANEKTENIFVLDSLLGTKIADLKENAAIPEQAKSIWNRDFSLNGNKPSGWKINDGNVMNEAELKNTILAESQIKDEKIKITAVYDKPSPELKKIIVKPSSFFKIGSQVILDKDNSDSMKWLETIKKNKGELKVLNRTELLKESSSPYEKGYSVRDEYLFLYALEDSDYVVVKVEGYEDVFFKTQKSGFELYIDQISKNEVPAELISKI